jgi:hypothetical protein
MQMVFFELISQSSLYIHSSYYIIIYKSQANLSNNSRIERDRSFQWAERFQEQRRLFVGRSGSVGKALDFRPIGPSSIPCQGKSIRNNLGQVVYLCLLRSTKPFIPPRR